MFIFCIPCIRNQHHNVSLNRDQRAKLEFPNFCSLSTPTLQRLRRLPTFSRRRPVTWPQWWLCDAVSASSSCGFSDIEFHNYVFIREKHELYRKFNKFWVERLVKFQENFVFSLEAGASTRNWIGNRLRILEFSKIFQSRQVIVIEMFITLQS